MSEDLEAATKIAKAAGDLLVGYLEKDLLAKGLKHDFSVVTEADWAADRAIAEAIGRVFPGDDLLSEELAPVYRPRRGGKVWVVDPLDGTTNYSLGMPHWGVSMARCDVDGPDLAVLYFPALGEMMTAERGAGARLGGREIRTAAPAPSHPVGFLTCCSRAPRLYHLNLPLKIRILGSTAYSLAAVAAGTAALAFETRPKVWDLAAGWLLVEEAGGSVEPFSGSRPFPLIEGTNYAEPSFPVLAAATAELAARARESIEAR